MRPAESFGNLWQTPGLNETSGNIEATSLVVCSIRMVIVGGVQLLSSSHDPRL